MSDDVSTPDPSLDRAALDALLEEIPRLQRVRAFAKALDGVSYFARLGEVLDAGDAMACRHYLDGLGFPDAEPAMLDSWADAADAALALDVDPEGWEAGEMARAALTAEAAMAVDEQGLQLILALVADHAAQSAKAGVEDAAALGDADADVALMNAAVGGAVQAAHGAALALLAYDDAQDAAGHPFFALHQLYARGRWPVGLAGLTLNLM